MEKIHGVQPFLNADAEGPEIQEQEWRIDTAAAGKERKKTAERIGGHENFCLCLYLRLYLCLFV